MDAAIEVETGDDLTDFTEIVTAAQIDVAELSGDFARQFLYFHTEAFPLPALPSDLVAWKGELMRLANWQAYALAK